MAVYETGSRAETAALGERLAKVLRSGSLVLFYPEGSARGKQPSARASPAGWAAPTRSPAPRSPS